MATKPIYNNLDFLQASALIQARFEALATDPASPVEGQEWLNSTSDLRKVVAGGVVEEYAFRSWVIEQINLLGRAQGGFDASASALPVAGDKIAGDLTAIQAGDHWFINAAGTIAGIQGDDTLSIGDKLQFTGGDATDASNWLGVQTNLNDARIGDTFTDRILVDIPAGTPTTITSTSISDIHIVQTYLGTSEVDVCVELGTTANTRVLTVNSAVTGLIVNLTGTRAA